MTYTPTRETLELAALACGVDGEFTHIDSGIRTYEAPHHSRGDDDIYWQPSLPTTQGKADLLDMIFILGLDVLWGRDKKEVAVGAQHPVGGYIAKYKDDGREHAALAEAAIKVAAMVGANMKGGV